MADLTIVLSGPHQYGATLAATLANDGYTAETAGDSHGLPACTDGTDDTTVGWLTVTGGDVDPAAAAAAELGWQLRAHWPTPPPPPPDPVAVLEARLAALEARLPA